MAYAFDKINKYLDKKNKDETNELFKSRPGTRSQTSVTGSDFKALPHTSGQKGALATTYQPGQKFSKAAAGRKAFKSLRGEKGDKIPGFLGGMRSDFDERKASLTKKVEEFKTKTEEEDKKATSLPQDAGDEIASEEMRKDQTIEDAIITGDNEYNTALYKRILEGSKKGGPEIEKPELPPLPKISIPEGKQVSKQAISDILRSGKKRYTPGISEFDTRLFYSIPGFSENVKELGKDQAALRGELETLYEETYTKAVADRKQKYEEVAKRIDNVVKKTAGNITEKQKNEAERLKKSLKDFYEKQNHWALNQLNKIIKDKYRPMRSNFGQRGLLGKGLGPALSSGSRDLNDAIIRRFYDEGVGSLEQRDKLLQKYLSGEPVTQADFIDAGAYTAQAFGTKEPYTISSPEDINTVDPSHMWTDQEVAMMKRAKALGDSRGENILQVPSVGKFGDQSGGLQLTLTNPAEKASNYPYIEKVLFGDAADKERKYRAVYNDILTNEVRAPRSGADTFGAMRPFYHTFGLPQYTAPGSLSLYNTHKKALREGGRPAMSFVAYLRREGTAKASDWMNNSKQEIMPAYGSLSNRIRGTKDDLYSKLNQSWFRPTMVGNIANEMKRQGNSSDLKEAVRIALMRYADGSTRSGGYSDYRDGVNSWRKSLSKMLGAANGSGYNFSRDTSPEAMKIKNELPGGWDNANYGNTKSLKRIPNGGGNIAFANLMIFLTNKLNDYSVADLFYQILAPATRRNAGDKKMRGGIFDENKKDDDLDDWRIKKILDLRGGPNATASTISWLTPKIYGKAFTPNSTVLTPNDSRILNEIGKRGGEAKRNFEAFGFRKNNKINMYSGTNLDRNMLRSHDVLFNKVLTDKRKFDADLLLQMMMGNDAMQNVLGANENYVW